MTTPHDQAHRRPPPPPPDRSGWLWLLAALLLAFLAWGFVWEPAQLVERDYAIALPHWSPQCDGLRVDVVADLHTGSPRNGVDKLDRVVQRLIASDSDVVLLAGDYVILKVLLGTLRRTGSRCRTPQAADRAQAGVRRARQPRLVEERRQGPARAGVGRRGGAGEPRADGDPRPVPAVAGRRRRPVGRPSGHRARVCGGQATTRR